MGYTIDLTEKELDEILEAYELRNDESYPIHVAWIIWKKLDNVFKDRNKDKNGGEF